MEKQKVAINTLPITIRVVEVGGKRMTKAVFNQIPDYEFIDFNTGEPYEGMESFGWVKVGENKSIIFVYENILYKDTYERQYLDSSLRTNVNRYKIYEKSEQDNLKHYYTEAKKLYEDDIESCKKINSWYEPYLQDSQQLYIAI